MENSVFNKLVKKFMATDQLGHFNKDNHSIMLYGIKNDPATINRVKQEVASITSKCKVVILDPTEQHTNIHILDIDL